MTVWDFASKNAFVVFLMVAVIAWLIDEVVKQVLEARTRRLWLANVERHGWPKMVYLDTDGNVVDRVEKSSAAPVTG